MIQKGSRDLSDVVQGSFRITIEGIGTFTIQTSLAGHPMAMLVAEAAVEPSAMPEAVPNPENSPWEVVSFDERAGELTVKRISTA